KKNKWTKIVAPVEAEGVSDTREGSGPAPVHSALTLYATLADSGSKLEQGLKGKKAYVHVVQTSRYNEGKASGATVRIGGTKTSEELELKEGDGAYVTVGNGGATITVENTGDKTAEVLLFDLEVLVVSGFLGRAPRNSNINPTPKAVASTPCKAMPTASTQPLFILQSCKLPSTNVSEKVNLPQSPPLTSLPFCWPELSFLFISLSPAGFGGITFSSLNMRRLLLATVLTAIILCLLVFSHASPIPSENLIPREDPLSFPASTNLFIRDDSTIATRGNEGENSMAQDSLQHGTASLDDNKDSRKRVSSTLGPPSAKRAKIDLPALRPQPPQPKKSTASVEFGFPDLEPQPAQSIPQAVVGDVETPEAGIPPDLTGEQAHVVLQVLGPKTPRSQLPWNTREPYRWSSKTKRNAIQFYGHDLPSNPNDNNALNAKLKVLWTLQLHGIQSEQSATERLMAKYRTRLLKGEIDGSQRLWSLTGVVQEGNEPWRTARNWDEAEREEDWGGHVWKWTQTRLKEVLAYVLNYRDKRNLNRDLLDQGRIDDTWKNVEAMNFEDFKKTMESVWERYLKDRKSRRESNAIRTKRRTLDDAGLASLEKYLLPERKTDSRII
ncbi:hypothetical protein H0H93_009482, partial [Arthromyces matolae]